MFDDPSLRILLGLAFVLIVCTVVAFVAAWYIER